MWTRIENAFQTLFATSGGIFVLFVQSLLNIRFRAGDLSRLFRQMLQIGVYSLPLAAMIGFFTGMIFSLNIGLPLQDYGAIDRLGSILSVAIVREFAPVFTAFIVAARVGAAMTAELGTMAVSEEVDTLRVLGIPPARFLAMPRVVGSLIMNPLLTVYSTATGLIGGWVLATAYFRIPSSVFWIRTFNTVDLEEITHGLIKALVFGALYSTICVYHGLSTTGGAEGVGRSTTRAVVVSLTMILVADFLLTRAMFG
ncbi:ABC transporter permease [bacterium]|nr:ABC transporter permease [bacterium]